MRYPTTLSELGLPRPVRPVNQLVSRLFIHPLTFTASWLRHLGGWRTLGIMGGLLLFFGITTHANPAMAQLFDTVEGEAEAIFGEYLDGEIIGFIFGLLRIVVWVSAVGFIFFAVYQAQRGEQW